MKLKNIYISLVFVLASVALPALAVPEDEMIVEKAVRIAKEYPGFMQKLIFNSADEIRADIKNSKSTDWRKAHLIRNFATETEEELDTNHPSALKKIEFVLEAANIWRPDLNHWSSLVYAEEGGVLLMRWLLERNPTDEQLAAEKFQLADESADEQGKGSGAYAHSVTYDTLAYNALLMGRPRDEQILLLKKGIQTNKMGQKKYPNFDYGLSLDTLYLKFESVPGGLSAKEYVDEWISFVKTKSRAKQGMSGMNIAGALFSIGRESEATEWADSYIEFRKMELANPNFISPAIKQRHINQSCSATGSFSFSFRALKVGNPELLASLNKKLCSALSEIK